LFNHSSNIFGRWRLLFALTAINDVDVSFIYNQVVQDPAQGLDRVVSYRCRGGRLDGLAVDGKGDVLFEAIEYTNQHVSEQMRCQNVFTAFVIANTHEPTLII